VIVGLETSFSSSEVCGISFLACLAWTVPLDLSFFLLVDLVFT